MNSLPDFKRVFTELTAVLLIFLFVYTASSKLIDWQPYKSVLKQSPLIGNYAGMVALMLPISELVVATLLIFQSTRLTGLYAALSMMVVFTVYIAYMILFVPDLPCSCGGVLKQLTWTGHLLFNLFFVVTSYLSIRLMREKRENGTTKMIRKV